MPLAQHHTDRQKQEWCQATRNRVSKACWVTLMARPGVGERQVGKNAGEMVGGMWLEAWKGRRLRHPCTGVGVGGAFPQSPAYASPPPPMLHRVRNRSVLLHVCGRVNWDKPFGELFVSTRAWLYAILTSGCAREKWAQASTRDTDSNAHSHAVCDDSKLETTQMAIKERLTM